MTATTSRGRKTSAVTSRSVAACHQKPTCTASPAVRVFLPWKSCPIVVSRRRLIGGSASVSALAAPPAPAAAGCVVAPGAAEGAVVVAAVASPSFLRIAAGTGGAARALPAINKHHKLTTTTTILLDISDVLPSARPATFPESACPALGQSRYRHRIGRIEVERTDSGGRTPFSVGPEGRVFLLHIRRPIATISPACRT